MQHLLNDILLRAAEATRASQAGFAAHLTKPVDSNLLVSAIRRIVEDEAPKGGLV